MDHALWPVGPVGKPTEFHSAYPMLAMNYTKYPQACKALIAFMLEADNFNPWLEAAVGYLTPRLNAYDANPVWTADPEAHGVPRRRQAHADRRRPGLGRREGGGGARRLRRARHVRVSTAPAARTPRTRCGSPSARRSASIAERRTMRAARCRRIRADDRRHDRRRTSNAERHARATAWERLKVNRNWLGFWFMLPAAAFLILFLAYPLGLGIWLSFTDARIGRTRRVRRPGELRVARRTTRVFWLSVFNTLLYTVVASVVQFAVGLYLALLLNENLPFKAMLRAVVLIPFIVPTVLSAIAFWWIFDSQFSIISWSLRQARADRHQHRLPRRRLERALVGDLRQHLARRAVRRHHAARRPADRAALALRGRDASTAPAAGRCSATSPIRCSRRSSPW